MVTSEWYDLRPTGFGFYQPTGGNFFGGNPFQTTGAGTYEGMEYYGGTAGYNETYNDFLNHPHYIEPIEIKDIQMLEGWDSDKNNI